jgi:hypothetical protein
MLSDKDLGTPSQLHPVFFGCYDWHSSVHGHLPSRWFRTTRAICRVFIIHSGGGVLANTAFGISFALDYAKTMKDQEFERLLVERSRFYFLKDKQIA